MGKKCWAFALALLLALTLAACGGNTATNNETTDEQSANPISGKVYQVNAHGDLFQWKWCKFYEDGTFLGISATWTGSVGGKPNYSYSKYYGVYSTDGAKLALDIGADSYAGVIKEDGEALYFGETELLDYTDKLNSDRLMSMFNSSDDGETATPIADAPTEPASDGESPTHATLDELLSALKEGLSKGLTRENSKGDCTVTRDGNLVTITIWDEKATKVAVSAASGNEDNLARWNQFASDMATTEKTCEDSLEAYGHAEAIIHFYVVDYENQERKLLSISGGKILEPV